MEKARGREATLFLGDGQPASTLKEVKDIFMCSMDQGSCEAPSRSQGA